MGRTRQHAAWSSSASSGRSESRQVAYSVWQTTQSQPNSTKTAAPKKISYDVSYESSFFNHYFETGVEREKAFVPTYRLANAVDPYSFEHSIPPMVEGQKQHYLQFYFNSKYDGVGSKVERPSLNLVIALDVSGSMGETFKGETSKMKIQVAQESLLTLLKQLRPEDSFGLIIFNNISTSVQPLTAWKNIKQVDLEKQIMSFRAGGGTDISSAVTMANEMFTSHVVEKAGFSNRVFFLTDLEVTKDDGLKFIDSIKQNSNKSLWSTVVGIGLDLTQDVIKSVSKTAGCNYCNVRSTETFTQLMDQEFSAIVTPIAFNVKLSLVSERYRFAAAYGSPEVSDLKAGETALFSTEFPSVKNQKGETRSGVILFRVEDNNKENKSHEPFNMHITWEDTSGISHQHDQTLNFDSLSSSYDPSSSSSSGTTTTTTTTTSTTSSTFTATTETQNEPSKSEYDNSGVRKAILLVRYTDFFKYYIKLRSENSSADKIAIYQNMRRLFPKVVSYFQDEIAALEDNTLKEELGHMYEIAESDDIPVDKPKPEASTTNNNNSNNNNNNNNNNNTSTQSEKPAVQTPNDAVSAITLADYGGPILDRSDDTMCCVCLAEVKSVTLLPCNHKCLCKTCIGQSIPTCPLCRSKVTGTTSD